MKSRCLPADPVPVEERKVRGRKQKQFETDRDKWLFPAGTTTVEVALPNELITEMDDVIEIVYPALRDRADFAYEACRYAVEKWKEGICTPEGKAPLALAAKKKKRRPAPKGTKSR
jgi:hypothetical protein